MTRTWTQGKLCAYLRVMRRDPKSQKDTLIFIVIAILFMLAMDHFVFGGKRSYIEKIKEDYRKEKEAASLVQTAETAPLVPVVPEVEQEEPGYEEDYLYLDLMESEIAVEEGKFLPVLPPDGKQRIEMVIDDVGMEDDFSKQTGNL